MHLQASVGLYLNLFMCLHFVGLITIYVLPRFIRGERSQSSTTSKVSVSTSNGAPNKNASAASETKVNGAQINGINSHERVKLVQSSNSHNNEQFIDNVPLNSNLCDTNVNTEIRLDSDNGIKMVNANEEASTTNGTAKTNDTNDYRREISTDNHLSMKIRERIDSETRNIEDFIDKTVTGIVELKDDLMRVNEDDMYSEFGAAASNNNDGVVRKRNLPDLTNGKEIETFLRKEINNANVLPAVLSNSHAD